MHERADANIYSLCESSTGLRQEVQDMAGILPTGYTRRFSTAEII